MKTTLIHNINACDPVSGRIYGSVLIAHGLIKALDVDATAVVVDEQVDGGGHWLTPGCIDVHTHGIEQYMYERSGEDLIQGLALVGRYGVTGMLPTLYACMRRDTLKHLEALTQGLMAAEKQGKVFAPGFHLEGPFLALPGAGALTIPGDMTLLDELLAATQGRVAAMSISPDSPNILPVIERCVAEQIVVFMTHTKASAEQTQAAITAGARHATHFYNVFPAPPESEPGARAVGAMEAILADPRVSVDIIADGVHVHPLVLQMALAAKAWDKVMMVTDANIGAGLAEGEYDPGWGYKVQVSHARGTRIADPNHPYHGCLAGSNLTMNRGLANVSRWLKRPLSQIIALASCNPARLMNWHQRGRIGIGATADLVLWDIHQDQPTVLRTWCSGQCVFTR